MNILMGVGNELRGDDGVGSYIAQRFEAKNWKAIDCSTVPENYAAVVKRDQPELVVIVDATDMNLPPGEMRIIPKEKIPELVLSSHSMPLSLLMDHLEPHCKKVVLIGIQPKKLDDFLELTDEVKAAADEFTKKLKQGLTSFSSLV